jgi:hypothetical protein
MGDDDVQVRTHAQGAEDASTGARDRVAAGKPLHHPIYFRGCHLGINAFPARFQLPDRVDQSFGERKPFQCIVDSTSFSDLALPAVMEEDKLRWN